MYWGRVSVAVPRLTMTCLDSTENDLSSATAAINLQNQSQLGQDHFSNVTFPQETKHKCFACSKSELSFASCHVVTAVPIRPWCLSSDEWRNIDTFRVHFSCHGITQPGFFLLFQGRNLNTWGKRGKEGSPMEMRCTGLLLFSSSWCHCKELCIRFANWGNNRISFNKSDKQYLCVASMWLLLQKHCKYRK